MWHKTSLVTSAVSFADRPIILSESAWHNVIVDLYIELRSSLKENFLALLSAPRDNFLVFDSNVLIVVKERRPEIVEKILEIVDRISEKYGNIVSISPLITTREDSLTRRFMSVISNINSNHETWLKVSRELKHHLLNDSSDIVEIVFAPYEDFLVFDSNVLIVVKERRPEIVEKILEIVDRINEKYGNTVSISPLITTEDDHARELFKKAIEED